MPGPDLTAVLSRAKLTRDDDGWMAEAVHRLGREFGGALGPADIEQVVSWSRADLDGPHPAAMPELVERLARQRLLQRIAAPRLPVG